MQKFHYMVLLMSFLIGVSGLILLKVIRWQRVDSKQKTQLYNRKWNISCNNGLRHRIGLDVVNQRSIKWASKGTARTEPVGLSVLILHSSFSFGIEFFSGIPVSGHPEDQLGFHLSHPHTSLSLSLSFLLFLFSLYRLLSNSLQRRLLLVIRFQLR